MKPKIKRPVRIAPGSVSATTDETDERFEPPVLPGADVVSIALDLEGWRPASEVLDRVTAVPTRFFDFDLRNTVGGLPVRRIHTVSGPTTGGKTAFVLGLLESFIDRGHIGAYVDAEHATGQEFVEFLLDKLAHSPNFYARRPKSYEETMDQVDALIERIAKLRVGVSKKKDEPAVPGLPDLCSILVVDSINKLVPERELKAMRTVGADEIAKGHFGRLRAAINQAWLDHVVPILADANMAFVAIAQEREESDGTGGGWSVKQAEDLLVHIKGGRALQFDASMLMRVTRKHAVFDSDAANGKSDDEKVQEARKREPIVGWAHRVRIRKSKVGQLEGSYTDCTFFTSTGRGMAPAGFDQVRDAVMVALNRGIIQATGSWYSWHRFRSQGRRKLLAKLYEDSGAREELFSEVRATINAAKIQG